MWYTTYTQVLYTLYVIHTDRNCEMRPTKLEGRIVFTSMSVHDNLKIVLCSCVRVFVPVKYLGDDSHVRNITVRICV